MQLTQGKKKNKSSHWWILKDDRVVIDLTLRPREKAENYPYKRGNPRGFMMTGYKRPSKRQHADQAREAQPQDVVMDASSRSCRDKQREGSRR